MQPTMRWYQTLAWSYFIRQAAAILGLLAIILWVAYREAERGASSTAQASLSAGGYVLERAFEQQGRSMDAGLEVFTQYSGNVALIEHALETGALTSLTDTLVENLPRLGAEIALVVAPDGQVLACTAKGPRPALPEVGILQMALAPEEAAAAGHPGPFYRGFLRVDWGDHPGVYHAVARPLSSPAGRSLGAMLVGVPVDDRAAVDLRRLAIAGPQRGDPTAHLALLSQFRAQGSTFQEAEAVNRLLAREPAFLAVRGQVLDGQRSTVLPFRVEGRNYLGMITPLHGVNALDLEMADVLMMPVDPLLAPFRNLQKAILAVGVAGLSVALALSLRSARKVTAPLKALVSAAQALAEGDPPESLGIDPTPDEVGVLTRTFKSMLAELKAKDQLLALLDTTRRGTGGPGPIRFGAAFDPAAVAPRVEPADERTRRLGAAPPDEEEAGLPEALREGAIFAARYRVDGLLGRGGMGVVLKVRDLQLDEDVALKVVRAGLAANPAFLDQLKQEIRLARKITHRYVLRTHDFGESDGIPYVTMEYLKGTTLRSLLDGRGRLPLALVLRIARQVAEGLEAAHAVGVVHRDIKPANVLFDVRGDAKIMDFGLAAPVAAVIAGEAGILVGSPRYMSPEQIRGERVDARTDLYALGVMLFELCSGLAPFDSPRINDLLTLHLEAPVPSLAEAAPDMPPDLSVLVHRLLEKRQADRCQSATEVAEILKLLATGGGTSRLG
ncbi:MAG: protein kinase [Geothrix sp.]|uniref:serine/threonine-protein kinase n=1 Tax=Geothrix sp. TaxID=1962974 RepID=UPI0017A11B08|nr:protein kinase [Geothrix sp.]NWJ40992.1 protein kinase [Geothrix sp.]WIL21011.1 MAG: protein kinase [Geothrix sp.]